MNYEELIFMPELEHNDQYGKNPDHRIILVPFTTFAEAEEVIGHYESQGYITVDRNFPGYCDDVKHRKFYWIKNFSVAIINYDKKIIDLIGADSNEDVLHRVDPIDINLWRFYYRDNNDD